MQSPFRQYRQGNIHSESEHSSTENRALTSTLKVESGSSEQKNKQAAEQMEHVHAGSSPQCLESYSSLLAAHSRSSMVMAPALETVRMVEASFHRKGSSDAQSTTITPSVISKFH